ncbi:hypothetical protein [Streptomyces sp. RKAG293]|uniref:hypothetical protein n=1 Tax=Streptomyces sp. RKAG293 TaxID=2893403 RepID=UPI002033E53A|nr:hypothetical protein [Streptomyces sp. RKAG293]MCM2416528.1 hypothetical protein [Streptomyces sp. RKAG293]
MICLSNGTIADSHRQVSPGTSPSITGLLAAGRREVAFREANSQHLWLMGQELNPRDTGSFIQPNASLAIATLTRGNVQVAFNGPSNHLFQGDAHSGSDTGSFIASGISPSIAPTANQTYEVAFVGPGNVIWEGGPTGGGHIAASATGGVVNASGSHAAGRASSSPRSPRSPRYDDRVLEVPSRAGIQGQPSGGEQFLASADRYRGQRRHRVRECAVDHHAAEGPEAAEERHVVGYGHGW